MNLWSQNRSRSLMLHVSVVARLLQSRLSSMAGEKFPPKPKALSRRASTAGITGAKTAVACLMASGTRRMLTLAYNKQDYHIELRVKGLLGGFAEHGLSARDAATRRITNNAYVFPLLMRRLSGTNA